jgi:hypothetical protein
MIEYIVIGLLVWILIGSIRFLFSLEDLVALKVQLTGIDWVISGPFYLLLLIVTKIKGS